MNTDQLNKKFSDLLATGSAGIKVRQQIGMSAAAAATYRNLLKEGKPISIKLKMQWLQKAGFRVHDPEAFSKQDLVDLARFILKQGSAAKEIGAEYLVEKFLTPTN